MTGKATRLKKANPDRGALLICLIASILIVIFCGLIVSAKSTNPIETLMFFFRDGMTLPEVDPENSDPSEGTADVPTFIVPDISIPEETTDDAVNIPETTHQPDETSASETREDTTNDPATTLPPDTTISPEPTETPETTKTPETTRPDVTTAPSTTAPQSDEEYFSDALFIGDSRTVGFYTYSRIPGATYFARTSMTVFNAFEKGKKGFSETSDTSSYDLTGLLTEKKFGKIYILLGINELGYPISSVVSGYSKLIGSIQQLQPDAKIIIQSNMHVTKKKSEDSSFLSNPLIDELNLKISRFADNKKVFYLDFEEIFDGADGAMSPEYSGDGVHLYGKCYKLWLDWMLENGKIY